MGFLNFIRGIVAVIGAIVFPIASLAAFDLAVFEDEFPTLLSTAATNTIESPQDRRKLVKEITAEWLAENPNAAAELKAAGLNPETTVNLAFDQLSRTPKFVDAVEVFAETLGEELVSAEGSDLTLDLEKLVDRSEVELPPIVMEQIQANPIVNLSEELPEYREPLSYRTGWLLQWALTISAFGAAATCFSKRPVRHLFGSLAFVGGTFSVVQLILFTKLVPAIAEDSEPMANAVESVFGNWILVPVAVCAVALALFVAGNAVYNRLKAQLVADTPQDTFGVGIA